MIEPVVLKQPVTPKHTAALFNPPNIGLSRFIHTCFFNNPLCSSDQNVPESENQGIKNREAEALWRRRGTAPSLPPPPANMCQVLSLFVALRPKLQLLVPNVAKCCPSNVQLESPSPKVAGRFAHSQACVVRMSVTQKSVPPLEAQFGYHASAPLLKMW
jgi:hypothetical protein